MEIISSLQFNPLQVADLLLKQLDAFVVASKGAEQIDSSVCATRGKSHSGLGKLWVSIKGTAFCLWIELPSIRICHRGELLITNAPGRTGGRPGDEIPDFNSSSCSKIWYGNLQAKPTGLRFFPKGFYRRFQTQNTLN